MQKGDFVEIEYVGKLESGEVFDLTDEELAKKEKIYNENAKYGPVPVIIGAGMIVPGLDESLEKLSIGKEEEIKVTPEKAFGQRNPDLIRVLPRSVFKEEPKPGMVVNFDGHPGRIQSVSAGRVRIDFNSPLAGKTLIYKIKIVKEIKGIKERIEAVLEYFRIKADVKIEGKEAMIEGKIQAPIRIEIGKLITKYAGIDKIKFVEVFEKQ